MATRPRDVEILVHVNAPSRVADDAHYRQLAEAYIDFEPNQSTAFPSLKDHGSQHNERLDSGGSSSESHIVIQRPVVASSSQEYATPALIPAFIDSQDLSFQSALDNRESPRLGDTAAGVTLTTSTSPARREGIETQQSWRAPPSEIADSYPMPDPSLLRGSPSKVLECFLRSSTSRNDNSIPCSVSKICSRQHFHHSSQVEVPSSPPQGLVEVPSSQPERVHLPTIPSSPPYFISHVRKTVPISSDSEQAEDRPATNTSDAAVDITHILASPLHMGSRAATSQREVLQPVSDDLLDVTHITGSLIEGGQARNTSQERLDAPGRARTTDGASDASPIPSNAVARDVELLQSQRSTHVAAPEDHLDITHISMSSDGDGQAAAPSQKRYLLPEGSDHFDVTDITSSSFDVSGVRTKTRSPPATKQRRHSQSLSPSPIMSAGVTDLIAVSTPGLPSDTPPSTAPSLEIMPPSPPPGLQTIDPGDLIPPQLSKLAADLSSRYRPSAPARDLDPLERGHWLLDCETWPAGTRDSTWAFLTRYVRSGLAGWGVCCRREENPHRFMKLYCWGHVVKHTYLLLYLASERRLKGTGAVWIDADGETVITVIPNGK